MLPNPNPTNNFLDFFKNPFPTIAKAITDSARPQQTQVIGGNVPLQSTIPSYPFAGYQIKPGDTFSGIATANGLQETDIQQANNNMLVPPPTGSYINVPIKQPPLGLRQGIPEGVLNYQNGQANPQNLDPSNALNAYRQGEKTIYNPYDQTNPYGNSNNGLNVQQSQINQIVASGQLPANIPFGTQILNPSTGQPATFQNMVANGYQFNPATNSWTLAGGQGVPVGSGATNVNNTGAYAQNVNSNLQAIQTGKNDGTFQRVKASENYGAFVAQEKAFLSAKRWDPKSKTYVSVGKLINQGKLDNSTGNFNPWGWGGGGGGSKPKPKVLGSGTQQSNQLNVNQGGG